MILGFTGTQRGMTDVQRAEFCNALLSLGEDDTPNVLHEGDCIGSDAEAAHLARGYTFQIISHPPTNPSKRAFFKADMELPPFDYLIRNHHIVDASQYMLATPGEMEEQMRSGTWATVRYFKRAKHLLGWAIIYPDGTVENADGERY